MKKIIVLAAAAALAIAGWMLWRDAPLPTELARYQMESFRLAAPDLDHEHGDDSYYTLSYPVFQAPAINRFLSQHWPRPKDHKALGKEARKLLDSHRDYLKQSDAPIAWFQERHDRVARQTPTYIGFQSDAQSYTGGAHGHYSVHFLNYDVVKERLLTLADVLKKGGLPVFLKRAEQRFREQEGVPPDSGFDQRYFFQDGRFDLTSNYTFTHEGLLFLYNIYEIKAYSEGQTELLMPYEAINDLLNETGQRIRDALHASPQRTDTGSTL